MRPTELLKEEHNAIKLMLRILERVCNRLDSGEEVEPRHLEQILDFIRTFADRCHHGKEEDLLFPAMEGVGIPREGGPIAVMLTEHNRGRDLVRMMGEGIEEYSADRQGARSKIAENAQAYIQLLREHIDKEDNVLYPMADAHLPAEKQQGLLEEFERVEEERIGKGKHEEFHRLLHELERLYLS